MRNNLVCYGRSHALGTAHSLGLVTGNRFRSLRGQLVNDSDSVSVFLRRFFKVVEYSQNEYWDGTFEEFHLKLDAAQELCDRCNAEINAPDDIVGWRKGE